MSSIVRNLSILLLLIPVTTFDGFAIVMLQSPPVDISYSLSSQRVSLHEPVTILFGIRDNLGQTVTVDLGRERTQNFRFEVVRPDGTKVQARPPMRGGFSPAGAVKIKPGETFTEELLLGAWFDFALPGRYQIGALLKATVKDEDGRFLAVDPGAQLELSVDARDEQQLRNICADLLNKISSAQSYSQAEKAAKTLSIVNDPIAVSFLKQATGMWHLAPITIAGLRRIGGSRSVDALISLLNSADPDARALARSALMAMETQTADVGLKETIRRALQIAGEPRPE